MSIYKSATKVSGNTYQYRELLRSLGGRWDKDEKVWILPPLSMRERSTIGVMRGCNVTKA